MRLRDCFVSGRSPRAQLYATQLRSYQVSYAKFIRRVRELSTV